MSRLVPLLATACLGLCACGKKPEPAVNPAADTHASPNNGPGGEGLPAPKPSVYPGWGEYRSVEDGFRIEMCKPVAVTSNPTTGRGYRAYDTRTQSRVQVQVMDIPPNIPPFLREGLDARALDHIEEGEVWRGVSRRRVEFAGSSVVEVSAQTRVPENDGPPSPWFLTITRALPTDRKIYVVLVWTLPGATEPVNAEAIFGTFQLLK